MSKSKNTTYAAVLAIAVIAVFAFWQLGGADLFKPDTTAGTILTINYTDGTKDILDSNGQKEGLAIKIPDTGKTMSSVKVEVYVAVKYTGTISKYTVSGTFRMRINKVKDQGEVEIYNSGKQTLQPLSPLPTLKSGDYPKVISSATTTAGTIEGLYSGWQNDQIYIMYWEAPDPLSMTIIFTDGQTLTRTATPQSVSLTFIYSAYTSSFSDLTVTFWKTVYY